MEQLSQSPFFPVPVRWFEIPMQTARWGLGQLAQSTAAESTAAAATSTEAAAESQPVMTFGEFSTEADSATVGTLLNEYA